MHVGVRSNVFAGSLKSNWVAHVEVSQNARMKIGHAIYPLRATLVNNAHEFETFTRGRAAKYGRRPFNESVDDTYLVQLIER